MYRYKFMQIEIVYNSNEALRLAHIAENIASGISKKLQPLSGIIDQEDARIFFHFGCKDFFVEVDASRELKSRIKELLDHRLAA